MVSWCVILWYIFSYKSNEDYVYVRGRGRGKYICEECGIRCKKPSMLRKHIRTHSDIRPFHCTQCNFSFKTKGGLIFFQLTVMTKLHLKDLKNASLVLFKYMNKLFMKIELMLCKTSFSQQYDMSCDRWVLLRLFEKMTPKQMIGTDFWLLLGIKQKKF